MPESVFVPNRVRPYVDSLRYSTLRDYAALYAEWYVGMSDARPERPAGWPVAVYDDIERTVERTLDPG
jgi:hypothetical protein